MAQTALTRFSFLPRPRGGAFLLPCIRHGAGLLFYLAAIQTHAIVYSVFCSVNAVIPPAPQNSAQSFTVAFPAIFIVLPQLCGGCICLCCTVCATLERITAPVRHTPIPDTRRHAQALYNSAQPPIIIRYIMVQGCAACYGSMPDSAASEDHASPAGSSPTVRGSLASAAPCAPAEVSASPPVQGYPGGGFDASRSRRPEVWRRVSSHGAPAAPFARRGSPAAGARRAARNYWRLPPQLFRAFAR